MPDRAPWQHIAAGGLAVFAVYLHFLLFAQFGFLDQLQASLASSGEVQLALAAMGIAGLLASLATAAALRRLPATPLLAGGLALAAFSAALSPFASGLGAHLLIALLTGGSLGIATVTLAADLPRQLPAVRRGLWVGGATGSAYALGNWPALFEAAPAVRAWVPAALCAVAAAALLGAPEEVPETTGHGIRGGGERAGFGALLLAFLALVWLDSAAFAVIQESAALKALTWGAGARKPLLGAVHLGVALLAGGWLDRGWSRRLPPVAWLLFATAVIMLRRSAGVSAAVAYATAVSLYSVALVLLPSAAPGGTTGGIAAGLPPRWRAALLFGIAGWLGSALGVGMAQDLHRIPAWFVAVAGVLVLLPLLRPWWGRARQGAVFGAGTLFALLVLLPTLGAREGVATRASGAVARGREVYIAEGCIHCHSQYVRPVGRDERLWGPHREVDRRETPPLIGNRRQGPDLANAGNRRSAPWHRLHLLDPRILEPRSRMPSYRHLFAAGDRRGEDLVAYLASLGADSARQRFAAVQQAPVALPEDASPRRGDALFRTLCAPCHGDRGRGNGPLSPQLGRRPAIDLGKGAFWLVGWSGDRRSLEEGVARVVRYGVPGTSMPGHELLTDREVGDLVAFVLTLSPPGERG